MSDKYPQMGNWFDQMDIKSINLEHLTNKYGENFSWRKSKGAWFFNEGKREITFYDIHKNTIETHNLDELKEKARGIIEERGIKLEIKSPEKVVNKMIEKGLDMDAVKNISDDGIMLMFGMFWPHFNLEDKFDEKEIEIFECIPYYEMKDVLFPNLTQEQKLDIFLGFTYKMMQPLKIEKQGKKHGRKSWRESIRYKRG